LWIRSLSQLGRRAIDSGNNVCRASAAEIVVGVARGAAS
jgi:hypothetical protein